MIGRGRGSNIGVVLSDVSTSRGRGVDRLSGVLNGGDVAVGVVGGVGDSLDPAVGEGDGVRATDNTVGISGLSSVEVGLGVVVRDTIGEGVGLRGLLGVFHRGVVGRGRSMVDHRGRGMVGNRGRGMVSNRGRGMVGNRGRGMVGNRSMVGSWSGVDNSVVAVADAVSVSDSVSNMGHMGHGGSAGQAKQGGDHEGLKRRKLSVSSSSVLSILSHLHSCSVTVELMDIHCIRPIIYQPF